MVSSILISLDSSRNNKAHFDGIQQYSMDRTLALIHQVGVYIFDGARTVLGLGSGSSGDSGNVRANLIDSCCVYKVERCEMAVGGFVSGLQDQDVLVMIS